MINTCTLLQIWHKAPLNSNKPIGTGLHWTLTAHFVVSVSVIVSVSCSTLFIQSMRWVCDVCGSLNRSPAVAESLFREPKQPLVFKTIQESQDNGKTHSMKCVNVCECAYYQRFLECTRVSVFLFLCIINRNASVTPFFVAVMDESKKRGQCMMHVGAFEVCICPSLPSPLKQN